jgi:hypothetical protein
MTSATDAAAAAPNQVPTSLGSRFLGVLLSPRQTFEGLVAAPRWLGMTTLVTIVATACTGWFLSTEVGQLAYLDAREATGRMGQEELERVERTLPHIWYIAAGGLLVGVPAAMSGLAAVLSGAFKVAGGGRASLNQVLAVVSHSAAVLALQQLIVVPLNYARESMSSPTNLTVFLPMLTEGSFPARMLGIIDLFYVWWLALLATGLAVLYRRRTRPIAMTLLGVYVAAAIAVAAVMSVLGRA